MHADLQFSYRSVTDVQCFSKKLIVDSTQVQWRNLINIFPYITLPSLFAIVLDSWRHFCSLLMFIQSPEWKGIPWTLSSWDSCDDKTSSSSHTVCLSSFSEWLSFCWIHVSFQVSDVFACFHYISVLGSFSRSDDESWCCVRPSFNLWVWVITHLLYWLWAHLSAQHFLLTHVDLRPLRRQSMQTWICINIWHSVPLCSYCH